MQLCSLLTLLCLLTPCCNKTLVYFVEGIMDMNLLAITYFIKDTLGLGPAEVRRFSAWVHGCTGSGKG